MSFLNFITPGDENKKNNLASEVELDARYNFRKSAVSGDIGKMAFYSV